MFKIQFKCYKFVLSKCHYFQYFTNSFEIQKKKMFFLPFLLFAASSETKSAEAPKKETVSVSALKQEIGSLKKDIEEISKILQNPAFSNAHLSQYPIGYHISGATGPRFPDHFFSNDKHYFDDPEKIGFYGSRFPKWPPKKPKNNTRKQIAYKSRPIRPLSSYLVNDEAYDDYAYATRPVHNNRFHDGWASFTGPRFPHKNNSAKQFAYRSRPLKTGTRYLVNKKPYDEGSKGFSGSRFPQRPPLIKFANEMMHDDYGYISRPPQSIGYRHRNGRLWSASNAVQKV